MTWLVGPGALARLFTTGAVTPRDCVDAVEASFREHGEDKVGVLPRAILTADGAAPSPRSRALKLSASYMRSDVVAGPGGRHVLLEDPSGNPVELFQPSHSA